jgi:hypothetical protein
MKKKRLLLSLIFIEVVFLVMSVWTPKSPAGAWILALVWSMVTIFAWFATIDWIVCPKIKERK